MKIFVTAGEASGDRLGAAMLDGFTQLLGPDGYQLTGVGGPLMEARGLKSLFPMDDIAVMGVVEILRQYRHLKRRIHETAEAVIAAQPDVLITIDLPEFSLRVAHLVKACSDIRTMHYVAPTVWAWRKGRAQKMARDIDHVLALLPFEPPYMTWAGMACDFVGHPVVSEPQASTGDVAAFRARHGIGDAPLLLMLPGSRRSEVSRLLPIFEQVLPRMRAAQPDLRVVLPVARGAVAPLVREAAGKWPGAPILILPDGPEAEAQKRAAFAAADVALAASGTVSLELAAARTPMVIAYQMGTLSHAIISRMLLVDTVTLVNLVSDSRVVPEFIGPRACDPDAIAQSLLEVLAHPGAQQEAMALTMARLGEGAEPPGLRAARAVLDGMGPQWPR